MANKSIQRLLVSFNVVFLLLSVALIIIGSLIISKFSGIFKYVPPTLADDKLLIQEVGVAAISIGVISAVISFLGCCSAAKESRRMLFSFLIIMVVIFLAVLVSGIVAVTRQELVKTLIGKTLTYEAEKNTTDNGMLHWAFDQFQCCGIEDNAAGCDRDYPPFDKNSTSLCPMGDPKCEHGCLLAIWNFVSQYIPIAATVLFVLSGVVLIGIVFAAVMFKSVSKSDYSYVRQD